MPLPVFTERMSPDSAAHIAEVVTKAIEAGEEFDGQIEIVDGPTAGRWVRWRGRTAAGNTSVLHGVTFDITETRRAEVLLRENEGRQRFLLRLSDTLRPLREAHDLKGAACDLLGHEVRASRVYFVEIDEAQQAGFVHENYASAGLTSIVGRFAFESFPTSYERLRTGETWIVNDAAVGIGEPVERKATLDAGVAAWINVPLMRDRELEAILCVTQAEPRDWSETEVRLVEETADRLWSSVRRGRAEEELRDSGERLRRVLETDAVGVLFFNTDGVLIDANHVFLEMTGWTREDIASGTLDWRRMTPPEHVAASEAQMEALARTGRIGPYEKAYFSKDGSQSWMLFAGRDLGDGTIVEFAIDVKDRKRAEAALAESEQRFRSFAENSADTLWIADAATGRLEYLSPAFEMMFGEPRERTLADPGRWAELVHPEDRPEAASAMPRSLAGDVCQVEYRVTRPSDGAVRWLQDTGFPIRDESGKIYRVAGITQDVTDRRNLENRQGVLLGELQHRVRNILGVVRSMTRRTSLTSETVQDFATHIDGRINALARVQGVLTRNPGQGVSLATLIGDELDAYGRDENHLSLTGPEVWLEGKQAESFALAVHELATNAVKHGALGNGGRLDVRWGISDSEEAPRLHFAWVESGVSIAVGEPRRRGFGTELIEKLLPYELKATTKLEMTPDGARCTVEMPLDASWPGLTGPPPEEAMETRG